MQDCHYSVTRHGYLICYTVKKNQKIYHKIDYIFCNTFFFFLQICFFFHVSALLVKREVATRVELAFCIHVSD